MYVCILWKYLLNRFCFYRITEFPLLEHYTQTWRRSHSEQPKPGLRHHCGVAQCRSAAPPGRQVASQHLCSFSITGYTTAHCAAHLSPDVNWEARELASLHSWRAHTTPRFPLNPPNSLSYSCLKLLSNFSPVRCHAH